MTEYRTYVDKETGRVYLAEEREINGEEILDMPDKFDRLFREQYRLHERAEEYIYIVATNRNSKAVGIFEISHGTTGNSPVSAKDIFVKLFLLGASGFVMVHNHPSGDTTPSEADVILTQMICGLSKLMGVDMMDHIIIGDDFYSFCENHKL